ncbi:MAG: hypothetical protein N3A58_03880 [Spirochaetes bacterium]|nr:hypothetical protein [Spirochaetota bacterium]
MKKYRSFKKVFVLYLIFIYFVFLVLIAYFFLDIFFSYINFKNKNYINSYLYLQRFNEKICIIIKIDKYKNLDLLNIYIKTYENKCFENYFFEQLGYSLDNLNDENLLFILSLYYLNIKNIEKSCECLKKILIINPKNLNAKINYEILLSKKKETEENKFDENNYLEQINKNINSFIKSEGFDNFQKNLINKTNDKIKKNW